MNRSLVPRNNSSISINVHDYPCTKATCPIYQYCDRGKRPETRICVLRRDAANAILKRGLDPLAVNWELLIKSMMWLEINSMREHIAGEPGELS